MNKKFSRKKRNELGFLYRKILSVLVGFIILLTMGQLAGAMYEKSSPNIWINPTAFNLILKEGLVEIHTLTIGNEPTATGNLTFNISFAGDWGGGWIEQWNYTYGGYGHSQLAQPVGDIDEDGKNETIVGGYGSGGAHILSYNTSIQTYQEEHFWTHAGGFYDAISGACVIDLDDNGDLELVGSWEYSGADGIHAYDWDGTTLTELDYYNGFGYDFAFDVYACDYDEDGQQEVLIANDPSQGTGTQHVTALGWVNGSFVFEASWSSGENTETPMIWSGDTDNDGHIEIIASGSSNTVYALNWNGSQWNAAIVASGLPSHPYAIVAGDIDNDGIDEIGIGLQGTDAYIYDWNGSNYVQVWHSNYPGEEDIIEAMYFGDADNDNAMELIVGTDDIHVITYSTGSYYEESIITQTEGQLAGAIIADMDDDGENEVKACDIISGPGKEWIVEYKQTWLSVDPLMGTVDIGDTIALNVTVNTTNLPFKTYNAFLVISSNDPNASLINIPVNLTVVFGITTLTNNWNFIAFPCNQSVLKTTLLVRYGSDTFNWSEAVNAGYISDFLFGWNRPSQYYTFANTLEPGYGYWLYADQPCEILIENATLVYDNFITDVEQNWNIISIPYSQSVNKVDIIVEHLGTDYTWADAVTSGLISDFIFGWSRPGQYYTFSTQLDPGYCYWIYAYESCQLKRGI